MTDTPDVIEDTLPEVTISASKDERPNGPASKPDAPSLLSIILSPGAALGGYLSQSGMSAESAQLATQMGQIKDNANGKSVRDCLQEYVLNAAKGGTATLCTPDKSAVLEEVAQEGTTRALGLVKGATGNVLGEIFGGVSTAIEIQNNHKDAIRTLAQNGHPGMSYKQEIIDGMNVKTWADATAAGLYPDDPKIKTYISVESVSGDLEAADRYRIQEYKKLGAIEAQTSNDALGSAQSFVGDKGYEAFRDTLADAPAIMEKQHMQDLAAVAVFRHSIRQQGPSDAIAFNSGP